MRTKDLAMVLQSKLIVSIGYDKAEATTLYIESKALRSQRINIVVDTN